MRGCSEVWLASFALALGTVILPKTLAAQEAQSLAEFAAEDAVYAPPQPPTPLEPSAPSFAPLDAQVDAFVRIPQARTQFDVTGAGLAVVVVDSGVNDQHISLSANCLKGLNCSTEGMPDETLDNDGHGSNVAGIIAAGRIDPTERMPTGIAYNARIVPIKVFPGGHFHRINAGLQWVIDNRQRIQEEEGVLISVVNMSLGSETNHQNVPALHPELQTQRELIQKLRAMDVAVVVAAGNEYFSAQPTQGMGFPAICPETVSVAAVYDVALAANTGGLPKTYVGGGQVNVAIPGRLTVFSQRLSDAAGSLFRTDICAPGFIVTSAGPVGGPGGPTRSRTIQDGTSQAAPVTSGLVLLMQERYRRLTGRLPSIDAIEDCLRKGGIVIQDLEDQAAAQMDNVTSCGASFIRIDAVEALRCIDALIANETELQELRTLQANLLELKPAQQKAEVEKFKASRAAK